MPVVKNAPRFNVLVRKRGDNKLTLMKNVIEAKTKGLAYKPSDYNLLCVHVPEVGYRMVNLDGIVYTSKPNKENDKPPLIDRIRKVKGDLVL
jgi:hypothetical protein